MTTTTTTSRKTAAQKTSVLSFAEITTGKMRDRIETYRGFVTRAAAGESLSEKELGQVCDLLEAMHLPDYAWSRDVDAYRAYQSAKKDEQTLESQRPKDASRAVALRERLVALEAEMKQVQGELFTVAEYKPGQIVNVMRRQNELETIHPHVLASLDVAVELRMKAVQRARTTPANRVEADHNVGWST